MGANTRAKVISFGLKGNTNISSKVLENDISGLTLEINGHEMTSRLVGRFNAYNLLVAFAVGKYLGQDELSLLTILSSVKAPQGRFEYFLSDHKITAVIDYAHTPDALENVLKTLLDLKKGTEKLITVFGCGGNRDKGKRPLMGEIASRLSDQVLITSDNPRNEDPDSIINEIYHGVPSALKEKVFTVTDRMEAIEMACNMASAGDVILIAGKGHENYQIIGNESLHFDDMENTIHIFKKLKK
jgi:UDP-N-acetylmuramoyl-L-alanyl-D-glutamate--2,6-diaminopimelate ligase